MDKDFSLFRRKHRIFFHALIFMMAIGLSSCYGPNSSGSKKHNLAAVNNEKSNKINEWLDKKDFFDPSGGLSRDDYYDLFNSQQLPRSKEEKSTITFPNISQFLEEPEVPELIDDKLVSLSVTENVPLKEVLIELARRGDVDMEIDPSISGGVIFRAKDRPFSEVIHRLSNLAGLRYAISDGVLKVERDFPTIINYKTNVLNLIRKTSGYVHISTNLTGGGRGGGSGGGSSGGGGGSSGGGGGSSGGRGNFSSGSDNTLEISSGDDGDFWTVVEEGVTNILRENQADTSSNSSSFSYSGATSEVPASGTMFGGSTVISVNRQAGVISILATDRQHKRIKEYLDFINISYSSQVLIEAKILEVSLNDEYRAGIDWNFINSNLTGTTARSKFNILGNESSSIMDQAFSIGLLPTELLGFDNTSIEATIKMVESFGATRTLSSPRINTMNNQSAILTFAENRVYFEVDIQEETEDNDSGSSTTLTIDSEIKTVPIGIIMALQPSIDLHKNEVVMSVRPTLSRVTSFITDPAVSLVAGQNNLDISSEIPIVEVRELDSVLRLKSGQVMVIGGLMEERSTNVDRGIPSLSKIPILGNAFKSVQKETEIVETVIFIKATIVQGDGITVEDRDFYRKFTRDRHNLRL